MKYAPGLMVGQLSGSTGSTVAGHNRFGSYFRSRTIPVNPNSTGQQDARALFGIISQAWQGLTDAQRAAWNAAALNVTLYDALGVAYNPTGHQYHQSINQGVRLYAPAAALLADPPTPDIPLALATITVTMVSTGAKEVAYTATPLGAGVKIVVEATRSFSPGKTFIGRSEYRQLLVSAAAAASPADIDTQYVNLFGEPIVDNKVSVRAFTINATGQRSAPMSSTVVVT